MSLLNRIAKKLRRRSRTKGTFWKKFSETQTTAQNLILNNWNITFSNPRPARAGVIRAGKRIQAKLNKNAKIPFMFKPTRQVRRAELRRWEKQKG